MLTNRLFRLINTQNREQTGRVNHASLVLIRQRRMLLLDNAEDGEGKMRLGGGGGGSRRKMRIRGITRLREVLEGK
jgi:hypothetical protein